MTASDHEAARIRFPDGSGRTLGAVVEACPPGAVVEIAPGRFSGPVRITRPITLTGAGDLSRLEAGETDGLVVVDAGPEDRVALESLTFEGGRSGSGAGLRVNRGRVFLHNVHIQGCRAERGGGALHVAGGEVDATLLRVNDVGAARGGAVWVAGDGLFRLRDGQIESAFAELGGAFAVEDGARVFLESVTVHKCRATAPSGGQAFFVSGTSGLPPPHLSLLRVRLSDVPFGLPVFVDPRHPGRVKVSACDVPRVVQGVVGVVDGGQNRWR